MTEPGRGRARRLPASAPWRRPALPLLALLLAGCASGGSPAEPPLEEVAFAPTLELDLGGMSRTPSGVYYQDLRLGEGAEVRSGATLTVHYEGWFTDGRRFDSTRESGGPVSFVMGRREVIRGWEDGMEGMRVGGLRRMVIPSRLGYGRRGVEGMVPPNSILIFEIELLQMREEE